MVTWQKALHILGITIGAYGTFIINFALWYMTPATLATMWPLFWPTIIILNLVLGGIFIAFVIAWIIWLKRHWRLIKCN